MIKCSWLTTSFLAGTGQEHEEDKAWPHFDGTIHSERSTKIIELVEIWTMFTRLC